MTATLAERFEAKVERHPDGCWLWQGFIDKAGYGRIRLGGRDEPVGYAHRVAYEEHVGPVPDGLHLDHLCRNRACVNPQHLEPVTCAENLSRGEHLSMVTARTDVCQRGHDFAANAYTHPKTGRRQCRACRRWRRANRGER